jgi:hypothetical protein
MEIYEVQPDWFARLQGWRERDELYLKRKGQPPVYQEHFKMLDKCSGRVGHW